MPKNKPSVMLQHLCCHLLYLILMFICRTAQQELPLFASLRFSSLRSSVLSDRLGATKPELFLFSSQGLEIVFRVGLAILQMNQTELVQLDMEGMLQVSSSQQLDFTALVQSMQNPPPLTSSRPKT